MRGREFFGWAGFLVLIWHVMVMIDGPEPAAPQIEYVKMYSHCGPTKALPQPDYNADRLGFQLDMIEQE